MRVLELGLHGAGLEASSRVLHSVKLDSGGHLWILPATEGPLEALARFTYLFVTQGVQPAFPTKSLGECANTS